MTAAAVTGARRLPATDRHAAVVMVATTGHAREVADALRVIPGVRATTHRVPAGGAGVTRVVEAAIARVAVRGALVAGPSLGAAVSAVALAVSPYGAGLAAVLGATVAVTGGLFAGGFAGFIIGLGRYERLLLAGGARRRTGDVAVVVRGVPCDAVVAAVDTDVDVVGCCDATRPLDSVVVGRAARPRVEPRAGRPVGRQARRLRRIGSRALAARTAAAMQPLQVLTPAVLPAPRRLPRRTGAPLAQTEGVSW